MNSQDEIKRHLKTFLGDVRRDVLYNTVNDDARVEELLQMLASDGLVFEAYSGAGYVAIEPVVNRWSNSKKKVNIMKREEIREGIAVMAADYSWCDEPEFDDYIFADKLINYLRSKGVVL